MLCREKKNKIEKKSLKNISEEIKVHGYKNNGVIEIKKKI